MENALNYAVSRGIIDLPFVLNKVNMTKRKEYLNMHPYKIWEGKDGRWYTYLPDDKNGRIKRARSSKTALEDDVIAHWKSKLENPTIREVFNEWNDRRLELHKISNATHLRNKQIFNRHYDQFGQERIKSISPEDIEDFLERQISRFDLTAKSFSNLKTITKGFLKRAKKRKLIEFNVEQLLQELDTSDTDFAKTYKEDYEEVFNDDEMTMMMQYLEENLDLDNLAILLMFLTGARIGEIVALKHSDFEKNTFRIRRTETKFVDGDGRYVYEVKDFPKSQAGVRTAVIPIDYLWVVDAIRKTNPHDEYIFVKDGKRITTNAVRMRLARLCTKLGIYHKSPHKIRKTYGSILLDSHIDNRLITEQMGHTDIVCTETHYHRNRRSIEQKSQILSSIPEFRRDRTCV